MKKLQIYRENGRQCRELAAKMPDARLQQLLDMAGQWEAMAEERERVR